MSIRFLCALCGLPQDLSIGREILTFSIGSICRSCFKVCETEFTAKAAQFSQPAQATKTISDEKFSILLKTFFKDIIQKGIKRAQIYNNTPDQMLVMYQFGQTWKPAHRQDGSLFPSFLAYTKRIVGLDMRVRDITQTGEIIMQENLAQHHFHLTFHHSTAAGNIITIAY